MVQHGGLVRRPQKVHPHKKRHLHQEKRNRGDQSELYLHEVFEILHVLHIREGTNLHPFFEVLHGLSRVLFLDLLLLLFVPWLCLRLDQLEERHVRQRKQELGLHLEQRVREEHAAHQGDVFYRGEKHLSFPDYLWIFFR